DVRADLRNDPRLARLEERLAGLREANTAAGILPTPENLPTLSVPVRSAIRRHQRAVAGAYSWRQAFSYPVRGGAALGGLLVAALAGGHALSRWLELPDPTLLVASAVALPALVRSTLDDHNRVPSPGALWRGPASLLDVLSAAILLLAAAAPAVAWVLLGDGHGLFGVGPLGFLALTALIWAGAWWASSALGVTVAFGLRRVLAPHKLALPGATLLAVSAVAFTLVAGSIWLLTAVEPILGIPLAALYEAAGLLLLGHLIGVMVRSRRLEWASSYAR
ncbi:MAG: hypothetical protein AAFX50_08980, partial [Acidobacteriota bacterium]